MKRENSWTNTEIKTLFSLVANYKENNRPLLNAFKDFALKYSRKTNSVRNFYYAKLKEFETNLELCKDMGISLSLHQKTEQNFFSEEEFKISFKKINELIDKGYSVRRACYEVANGDLKQMVRLQNKFHNHVRKKQIKSMSNVDNVFVMPTRKQSLTEEEISSLFLGLVKLVKKSAEESLQENLLKEMQSANAELRKSIKNLAEKEREVKILRKKFELMSSEKCKLKEEIKCLRIQNVELLKMEQYPARLNNLKNYIKKLNKSQPATTK